MIVEQRSLIRRSRQFPEWERELRSRRSTSHSITVSVGNGSPIEDQRPTTRRAVAIPAREIEAVVFDLDNTLLRSPIGASLALLTVAKLVSKQLKKNGYSIGYVPLFEHLRRIDHEMLGGKSRYNIDMWWKTLFKELGLKRMDANWTHDVTLQYCNDKQW